MKLSVLALLATEAQAGFMDAYKTWGWGGCPWVKPTAQANFNIQDYMGTWFEIQRDKNIWYEEVGETECVTATYTYNPWRPLYPVGVNNRAHRQSSDELTTTTFFNDENQAAFARARCSWGTGDCNVKFWWYPEGNYQILDTDYDTYSIVYGCDNWYFGIMHSKNAWLLSRYHEATDAFATLKAKATEVLTAKVPEYDWATLAHNTKQDNTC